MVYCDHILHTYACQHSLTTGMQNHFFDGRGFAEHQSSLLWSFSKNANNWWPRDHNHTLQTKPWHREEEAQNTNNHIK